MDGSDKINFYNYVTGVNSGERIAESNRFEYHAQKEAFSIQS